MVTAFLSVDIILEKLIVVTYVGSTKRKLKDILLSVIQKDYTVTESQETDHSGSEIKDTIISGNEIDSIANQAPSQQHRTTSNANAQKELKF